MSAVALFEPDDLARSQVVERRALEYTSVKAKRDVAVCTPDEADRLVGHETRNHATQQQWHRLTRGSPARRP
jgi:hypothetical protein